jgi:hypothetical protein
MALSDQQKYRIEAWHVSRMTKTTHCHQIGSNVKTFARRCRFARQAASADTPALMLVRLQPEPSVSGGLSLRWPGGHVLEIGDGVAELARRVTTFGDALGFLTTILNYQKEET